MKGVVGDIHSYVLVAATGTRRRRAAWHGLLPGGPRSIACTASLLIAHASS